MIDSLQTPLEGIKRPLEGDQYAGGGVSPTDFAPLTGTWVEGNKDAPATSSYAGGKITVEHVGNNQMTRWHTAVAAGDFDVGFKVRLTLNGNNFVGCGAFAGTSAGPHQRLENVGYLSKYGTNRFANQWWHASNNTFISEADIQTGIAFPTDQVEYWRVLRIGTTIYWFRSLDAISWDFLFKQLDDGYMGGTADRVGVLLNTNGVPPGQVNSIVVEGFASDLSSTGIPAAPFDTTAAGPYLVSTGAVVPAATSKITVAIECTPTSEATQGLFAFGTDLYAYSNSVGAINLQAVDDTGTDILSDTRTGKHQLLAGQLQTIVASVDLSAKFVVGRIVDGVLTTVSASTITTPNSGAFNTSLALTFLRNPWGSNQFLGSVTAMRVWFGEATTDGSEPVTTPDIEITGPASVINAHPWKQGADAT